MRKVAFLFPGQGVQYIGMGKEQCKKYKIFRDTLQEASHYLKMDMEKLCFEENQQELSKSSNTQPALITYGVATYRLLTTELGIIPSWGAGHSLGEITALTCSGGIPFDDALRIGQKRGQLMEIYSEKGAQMMVVRGINKLIVDEICSGNSYPAEGVEVVCYNSSQQTVLTGKQIYLESIGKKLEALGGIVSYIEISVQSHCSQLLEATKDFKSILESYTFHPLLWPVISTVDGKPYDNEKCICNKLVNQLVKPVLWEKTIEGLEKEGVDLLIDIGPKTTIKKLVHENNPYRKVLAMDYSEDFNKLEELKKREVGIKPLLETLLRISASTPSGYHNEEYNREVILKNVKSLREIYKEIAKGREVSQREFQTMISIAEEIIKAKSTSEKEHETKMQEVLEAGGLWKGYGDNRLLGGF